MDILFSSLIDTGWGAIILGIFLLIALLIEFFNKPKI